MTAKPKASITGTSPPWLLRPSVQKLLRGQRFTESGGFASSDPNLTLAVSVWDSEIHEGWFDALVSAFGPDGKHLSLRGLCLTAEATDADHRVGVAGFSRRGDVALDGLERGRTYRLATKAPAVRAAGAKAKAIAVAALMRHGGATAIPGPAPRPEPTEYDGVRVSYGIAAPGGLRVRFESSRPELGNAWVWCGLVESACDHALADAAVRLERRGPAPMKWQGTAELSLPLKNLVPVRLAFEVTQAGG